MSGASTGQLGSLRVVLVPLILGGSALVVSRLPADTVASVPATDPLVLVAMVVSVSVVLVTLRQLGEAWARWQRVVTGLAIVLAVYPLAWAVALALSAWAPHTLASYLSAVTAGVGHLPILAAFSVLPLLAIRYLGRGGRATALAAVTALGIAAAASFALFFDSFSPLAAQPLIDSPLGAQVGSALNAIFLATVLIGPAAALVAAWRSEGAAIRRLTLVAGSALAGSALVMVCAAAGAPSGLGAAVVLVGMYAAATVVAIGCTWALVVDLPEPAPEAATATPVTTTAAPVTTTPDPASTRAIPALTDREHEVLGLLAEGLSNAGIAQRLVLSDRTVDAHLRSVFTKLNLPQSPEHNRRVHAVNAYRGAGEAVPKN